MTIYIMEKILRPPKKITISFSADDAELLESAAKQNRLSTSAFIRQLLQETFFKFADEQKTKKEGGEN